MGISQLIRISRRSFRTFDAGMNTVAQNIANAETEGYTRRRITLGTVATDASGVVIGPPGETDRMGGVNISNYERVRDRLFEQQGRQAETGLGGAEEESRILGGIESTFAVGTDGSLTNVLNDFWGAWGDVANNPTDTGAREALLSQGDALTQTFRRLDGDFAKLRTETDRALSDGVDQVNTLVNRLGDLNQQIQKAQASGSPNFAAEDERDQVVRQLAEFAPIQVQEDDPAGYTVALNGMTLVQGGSTQELEVVTSPYSGANNFPPETVGLHIKDTNIDLPALDASEGKLGALTTALNTELPDVRNGLDALAADVVSTVNAEHAGAYDLNDNTGDDFFDAGATTANTIQLDVNLTSAEDIAVASAPGQPGNADAANALLNGREGIDSQAVDLVASVGSKVSAANQRASAQSAALAQVNGMAKGVSGVSLDEEMTKMIEYQQSFSAAARVLQTAQQMMDTLLRM